jgi:hypothetical protein
MGVMRVPEIRVPDRSWLAEHLLELSSAALVAGAQTSDFR